MELSTDNFLESIFNDIVKSINCLSMLEKKYANNVPIVEICTNLIEIITQQMIPKLPKIYEASIKCIFQNVQSNGFKSILVVINKWIKKIFQIQNKILDFKARLYLLNEIGEQLSRILTVCHFLCLESENMDNTEEEKQQKTHDIEYCLFANSNSSINNITHSSDVFLSECFYKELLGFHLCASIRNPFSFVATAMASYSHCHNGLSDSITTGINSLFRGPLYAVNTNQRAKQLYQLFTDLNVNFCRDFWNLTDKYGIYHIPAILCPNLTKNEILQINFEELNVPSKEETDFIVINFNSITKKLLSVNSLECLSLNFADKPFVHLRHIANSYMKTKFINIFNDSPTACSNLIFHVHGGGFIAQSSQSSEIYLRKWANEIDAIIISVDYSLAPDKFFPYQLIQCFYAYCWCLANKSKILWTGEQSCFVGDSAGGNLIFETLTLAIEFGIKLPTGLVPIYAAFNLNLVISPSRIMSSIDLLLSINVLKICLNSYLYGKPTGFIPSNDKDLSKCYLASPYYTQLSTLKLFPKCYLIAAEMDPLLDDSIEMAKLLHSASVDVTLDVAEGLPHGFVQFLHFSSDSYRAVELIISKIKNVFNLNQ